ncbi:CDP-glucose 4,6-dehydratase [Methylosinus sp. PW1]|uniref:CDP-glucose 4,6-dehydratase n=1 Tax=Methylosinus sp. PW1 TaxID=107636 RepID=UPI003524A91F
MEGLGVNASFWAGKRVLVTGHTGFKGGWLSLWLMRLGANVAGYALAPPTEPSLFALARLDQKMESVIGDIRDAERLARAVREFAPQIVFHLAAQPLVRYSYANPIETFEVNALGTAHLLETLRAAPSTRAIIVVTSDKCYENREWPWAYRENEAMGGFDPYSASKGCAELVAASFRNSYFATPEHPTRGAALATARAGNVIGGGDWAADRLVPDILRALERGETAQIRFPRAVRPWQHVLEPLAGYLTLAERLWSDGAPFAESWNFGPDPAGERMVGEIADALCRAYGEGAGWMKSGGDEPHEAHLLKLDSAKARSRLGWRPQWSIFEALEAIVDWESRRRRGEDVATASLAQIDAYERRMDAAEHGARTLGATI